MEALPPIPSYQPNYPVMCPFCRETANIADTLHEIVTTQLLLNHKTKQQTITISLNTEGKPFVYESPIGSRTATDVHRRIYITTGNADQILLVGFTFKYDNQPHTVCPFGTHASVLLNGAENSTALLGYIEDEIVDMVIGEASPSRRLRQVLALTRDELTEGTRCQQLINLYTSSHRLKEPPLGFSRMETYQSHNKSGTHWHQHKEREAAKVIGFADLVNET